MIHYQSQANQVSPELLKKKLKQMKLVQKFEGVKRNDGKHYLTSKKSKRSEPSYSKLNYIDQKFASIQFHATGPLTGSKLTNFSKKFNFFN